MCETKHSMKAMHAPSPSKPQHTNTFIQTSNWDRTQFYQCCIALMLLTEGAEYSNQSPIAKLECGGE